MKSLVVLTAVLQLTLVLQRSMSNRSVEHFDIGVSLLGSGRVKTACGKLKVWRGCAFFFSSIASHGGVWTLSPYNVGRIELVEVS